MKKLQRIELPKMNLHPEHRLSHQEMEQLHGGAGCVCLRNPFMVNDVCACDGNPFGLCKEVKCRTNQCINNFDKDDTFY